MARSRRRALNRLSSCQKRVSASLRASRARSPRNEERGARATHPEEERKSARAGSSGGGKGGRHRGTGTGRVCRRGCVSLALSREDARGAFFCFWFFPLVPRLPVSRISIDSTRGWQVKIPSDRDIRLISEEDIWNGAWRHVLPTDASRGDGMDDARRDVVDFRRRYPPPTTDATRLLFSQSSPRSSRRETAETGGYRAGDAGRERRGSARFGGGRGGEGGVTLASLCIESISDFFSTLDIGVSEQPRRPWSLRGVSSCTSRRARASARVSRRQPFRVSILRRATAG